MLGSVNSRCRAVSSWVAPLAVALAASACGASAVTARQEATLRVAKGEPEAAAERLRRRLAEAPNDVEARRLYVRVLGVLGELGEAEEQAAELSARLGGASPVPWVELGQAYELAHRFDSALAMYDRAASVAPRDPLGPRTGGLRAARWGERDIARPRLEEALRRQPRDAEVWHALGLVRLGDGDTVGAREAYRSGLRADPGALENRLGLATVALVEDDPAAALHEYDELLRVRPGLGDAELGRAWALMELGRLDEAERALERAAARGARAAELSAQRGRLKALRQGQKP
jgi:tetratricopeptide (TPR) repeat protein